MANKKKTVDEQQQLALPEDEEQTIDTTTQDDAPRDVDVAGAELPAEAQESAGSGSNPAQEIEVHLPDELPILPLRGLVVYPQTTIPLNVGQPRSIRLVDETVAGDRLVGLIASKDPDLETPSPDDIYEYGTLAQIHRLFRAPDGTIRLLVQGVARIRVTGYTSTEPYLRAHVEMVPEEVEESLEVQALMRSVVEMFGRMADLAPSIPSELLNAALSVEDPLQLVYALATYTRLDLDAQQNLLRLDSTLEKLRTLMSVLTKELEVLELGHKIQTEAQSEMEKMQREYFLREQLKAIQRELGEGDEQLVEVEEFRRKIEEAHMPEEAEREARRELDRLQRLPTAAAEYGVIRTYLDWLVNLPWDVRTDDNLDIAHAREVLEEDHYGLKDVKARILEYLAVRKLRQERVGEREERPQSDLVRREREGAILCFVGPPGVGKTSLGISIARAMGRKFTRLSLGGVRDEAEIRGFRRTYIGAMPGRMIQTLRRVESRNPVIMLDEVDKLGRDFRGDPASALLEVLDPEQNHEFRDHYLDVPFDLSEVMFITTANTLETIPEPLLDRMEIIMLSGYTEREKVQIAKQYLVPRQIRENGLRPDELTLTDEALAQIIRDYTREAGVRGLEREIGRVARKVVTRIAEGRDGHAEIEAKEIPDLLDHPRFRYQNEIAERTSDTPGVAVGLSVTAAGGDILFIEAAQMPGSKGFQYTGQLGQVMQESARAAFSYVRSKAKDLGLPEDYFEHRDVHLHVPAGAIPKDGPSAGVTMATALASLFTGRPVRGNVAMTGEITLRGQVMPVGGIKDKVLAAHRAGLDTVILPRHNEVDLDDVPDDVRQSMTFIPVDSVDKALDAALVPADRAVPDAQPNAEDKVPMGEV
ncbi:MAG TPA: endopeptidase La [Aggregatilinea sp.]|uniref:endopeptidase La n=1 Tax=Aggregatilinea sp. TaxID=2806333 RepID=UPI002C0DD00C|nr:endopeptidase La [Aggregatilinea sp.]HML22159.1 endopeptidase La [Aggregatilinea sp.]